MIFGHRRFLRPDRLPAAFIDRMASTASKVGFWSHAASQVALRAEYAMLNSSREAREIIKRKDILKTE